MGIVFALNAIGDNSAKNQITSAKAAADSLKSQAINAIHNNPQLAKSLLTEARQKYQDINDKNNMVDVDSQLYLIDHSKK